MASAIMNKVWNLLGMEQAEEDYEEEFRLNVLRLYDDISAYASKIFPYIKLLNTITTKEEIVTEESPNNPT